MLLGLSATVSHTAVVWVIALTGLYFGGNWYDESTEPYFQLVSGLMIIAVAAWMIWTTRRQQGYEAHGHDHGSDHDHDHDEVRSIDTGYGNHSHDFDVEFAEHAHHVVPDYDGLDISAPGYQDPHELAHANDIRRRFAGRTVTTRQIVVFGLTGGLIPCPASITVLLLCLQLKEVALGATLVLSFSIGLALTMVASGTLAALSVKHVSKRWSGFGELARKAPYVSGALIMLVGLYVGYQGWLGLTG